MIDNPEFVEDKKLYYRGPIGYVAFELWQVKSGSIFDNIIVTDSKDEAIAFAKETWGKNIEGEKKMKAAIEVCSSCLCCSRWLRFWIGCWALSSNRLVLLSCQARFGTSRVIRGSCKFAVETGI